MVYNLDNPLQREEFLSRASLLAKRGGVVELRTKTNRTLSQNAYLHSILSYFAMRYGDTLEYVKQEYFKKHVNPQTFWVEHENEIRGKYRTLRSTASLTTEEMSLCIDRFRDWASREAGVYLPTASEGELLKAMEIEVARNNRYI